MSIYSELKRRNVFRVAIAYLAGAWLLIEVAETLFPLFGFGDTQARVVVIVLTISFPLFLIFSWVFEITPAGLKRERGVAREDSITRFTGKKIDRIIIVLLGLALGYFAFDKFILDPAEDVQIAEFAHEEGRAAAQADPQRDHSIAILPFEFSSLDVAPFFGQLPGDLARLLQRSDQLRLASNDAIEALPADSSFADYAARLGVRYLVDGVVRFDDTGVSLSVSLFDNDTGDEVWAREFEDAQLQQTNNSIAEAIMAEINAKPISLPEGTVDPRTYELYLSARQHWAIDVLSEKAAELYVEAIQLDPRFAPAFAGYCSFLVQRYRIVDRIDDFEEAERICHRAWMIDTQSVEVHRALGDLYLESGQTKMARESYAAALAISPNDLMAQVNIAATYREEEPDLAEIQLKKIIQQHPGSPDAYRSLQYLYYRQGRYVEAVEQLEWVVRLLPDSEPDKSNLTGHLILAGMFDEAKTLLLEMLESGSPELGTIESNLASIQFFQGDYAAAADLYRTAIDREGDEAYLYRNLGDAIWHLDGKKAAEPIFRNAIQLAEGQLEINPDNIDALDTLMVAYGSISDSDRFEILKNRVLELAPNDPQIRYDIAVTASRIEDMESARLHAEKALELGYPVALLRADPDIAVSGASFD